MYILTSLLLSFLILLVLNRYLHPRKLRKMMSKRSHIEEEWKVIIHMAQVKKNSSCKIKILKNGSLN